MFILVFSCKKTGLEDPEISINEIGKYHNIALKLYYENYGQSVTDNLNDIYIRIDDLLKKEYPEKFSGVNFSHNEIESINYYSRPNNIFNYEAFLDDHLDDLVSRNLISYYFSGHFKTIALSYDSTLQEILRQVRQLRNGNISNNEKLMLDAFESTLIVSDNYWSTNSYQSKKIKLKCSSKVIPADAAGAALVLSVVRSGQLFRVH